MVNRRTPTARSAIAQPWRLTPLVAALAACWPLWAAGAPKAPAPNTVPVPMAGWRVHGQGGAAPVNRPNTNGGIDQTIQQSSQRAIYQWQSFDIGANSSVTFDMAVKNASALNRVLGSTAPSQIFGKLSATNGGEIYLINANGILFGRGAQVNTGSLVASALNVSDNEFLSGLTNSLLYDKSKPAFQYDGAAADFIDSRNFVRVDEGAAITTSNGGRVFLFAKRVENAGQISTPGGQTMLAAGGQVFLQPPSDQATLYASEANPEVPTLRGLLVEVGAGPADAPQGAHGSVVNTSTGQIHTPRGNATLVAMAVNQMGRISATTSVTENGSIILRAQGDAKVRNEGVRATEAGALVLGVGSQTTIAPDDGAAQNDGKPLTSDGNATFVNPRIDLAGASVLLDTGAQVVAPGATVDVRAEVTPSYQAYANRVFDNDAGDASRIVLGDGAVIDVSGTTTATESVSRYFVTTGLLGSNDLKDAPLQKDGLLYRSRVTVDVRDDSAILGSLEGYRDGLQQTIDERLSAGGEVRLTAGSGVLTHANSRIDVSGGQVTLTAAQVRETQLIGANGQLVDLNNAAADQVYTSALNIQKGGSAGFDRWGVKVNYGSLTPTRHEEGYVEGRAAGSVHIVAPTVVLQGQLDAHVTQGTRQQQGDDAQPRRGRFSVGAVTQGGQDFTQSDKSAVLRYFNVSTQGPHVDADSLWADAMAAMLPAASGMQRDTLVDAGFGEVAIAADGQVSVLGQSSQAALDLGDNATLRLLTGQGDAVLGGQVRSAGGRVELNSKFGQAKLADGAGVQLQGNFVNTLQDGPRSTTTTVGGSFSAAGREGVQLGTGSVVDVSGGAIVDASGKLTGGNAGSINLAHTAVLPGGTPGLVMNGTLLGQSLATGGSLSLTAPDLQLGGSEAAPGVLTIDPAMLQQGGFSSYVLDGRRELQVAAGSHTTLQRDEWQVDPRVAGLAASGSDWRTFAIAGPAPGVAPAAVNLTLRSSGTDVNSGRLVMHEGAVIDAPALSAISLSAQNQLLVDGEVKSAGGKVTLSIGARKPATPGQASDTVLWLGEHSRIDVSGAALIAPSTSGLRQGQVLDGGSITIAAKGSAGTEPVLVMQQGAELLARGASAVLDRSELTEGGVHWVRDRVDSHGGTVAIEANRALVTEGRIDLHAGGTRGQGGMLSVNLTAEPGQAPGPENDRRELRIAAGPTEKTGGLALGDTAGIADLTDTASISTSAIRASGAANLVLGARDALRFLDGADLEMAGTLTLASRSLAVQPGASIQLAAGQVQLQGVRVPDDTAAPRPVAQAGDAQLDIRSRDGLLVSGHWVTQGLERLSLHAGGDLMLHGINATTLQGSLTTAGDLSLGARQIYPGTQTRFRIDATGHDVTIAGHGGDASDIATPLSAGGQLTIAAATITQGGIVRAPQGQIVLSGSEAVTLTAGSQTSVSAAGLVLPYGTGTSDRWLAPDRSTLTAPPGKRIDIESPSVDVADGAELDLRGGGDLVAYEFVPGRGGSTDVFAGGNGAYALVPGVQGAALFDPTLTGAAGLGKQIEIGAGAPIPAGTYTLLPARYALQPGAFLIEPVKAGTPLSVNTAVNQADGSVWVGARLSTAGTAFADAQASTWKISPRALARQRSEIRETSANTAFTEQAAQQGVSAPERPMDAGTLALATTRARLDGEIAMAGAAAAPGRAAGRGGRAEFTAGEVVVGEPAGGAADGALHLSVATLNQLGADTLVLGARSGSTNEDGSTALTVSAQHITIATGGEALVASDLVLAASERIDVEAGSVLKAEAPAVATTGGATAFAIEGDGAALRLAAAADARLQRTDVAMAGGALAIGAGVKLEAGAGSLTLDATHDTKIAGSARLVASELTLGAPTITVGGPVGGAGVLALTPGLLNQVSRSDQLTLHAYRFINLKDGAVLGEDAHGAPTLDKLVLDTPTLRATEADGAGARITAGEITLTNSSGLAGGPALTGEGRISLHASTAAGGSGDIRLDEGRVVVQGADSLTLQADNAVALSSRDSTLAVGGDMAVQARGVVAGAAGADATWQVGGLLHTSAPADAVAPTSALGAALQIDAGQVRHEGRIVLPSGAVGMEARDGITLAAASRIDVAGRRVEIGEASVDLGGGQVSLVAQGGNLAMQGGVVNVSGAGEAAGGRIELAAPAGAVQLQSQLRGTSGGSQGAELSIDSGAPIDLASLARHIDETDPTSFCGAIRVRQREGDLVVGPQTQLAAREIELATDGGALTVHGTLDARGADGGRIALASQGTLTLAAGGALLASAQAVDGDGGRVELSAAEGTLQLQAGGRIDVAAGAQGDAGRVLLRAARLGVSDANPGGAGVDIAPLRAAIEGAGRIDVEAVKVYDGIHQITDYAAQEPGVLLTSTLAAEGRAFVGELGGKASLLAERLADGNEALQSALRIHAAAEVRNEGDLDVSTFGESWTTPSERTDITFAGGDVSAVGDSAITLRAGGDLTVRSSLDAGFHWSGRSVAGGSLRFVAGADLGAAASTATRRDSSADLVIGRDDSGIKDVRVRTTTGDITLAAAGDVNLVQGRARVFSSGVVADDAAAQAVRDQLFLQDAFRVDGGDIRVQAGEAVRSRSVVLDSFALYYNESHLLGAHPNGWSRIGRSDGIVHWDAVPDDPAAGLQHGVASFGGGRIDVSAGTDVQGLTAASPSSGFIDAQGAHQFGGGSVRVTAGRDVIGGIVQSGGRTLDVQAGRDVAWAENPALTDAGATTPGLLLAHENTAVQVNARRDLTLGADVSSHALNGRWISGFDGDASLTLRASGGNLLYRADAEPDTYENTAGDSLTVNLLPSRVLMAAPSGSLRLGADASAAPIIQQAENTAARLDLLAAQDLALRTDLQINATWSQGVAYHDDSGQDPLSLGGQGLPGSAWLALAYTDLQRGDGVDLDRSDRTPARLLSAEGDVEVQGSIRSARPLHLLAAGDIAFTGTNANSGVEVQHQAVRFDTADASAASELSLLRAGRDISLGQAALRIAGPGDLVLLAGRDIDLGRGAGVQAVGNIDNATRLAEGSSRLTLVAGLRADGADYSAATRRGFATLGAAALTARAGDLYALLNAADGTAPALGSAEAKAFAALGTDGQLGQVQALLGDAAYNAGIVRYVRGLVGHAGDSDEQALQAFATLSDVKRAAAPGALLAEAFGEQDASTRLPFVAAVTRADNAAGGQALVSFMQAQTGQATDLDAALLAFEALPLERQLLRLNAVLVDEVRTNGRAAVAARLATDKEAAYDRGYAAINSLFPVDSLGRAEGEIRLPTTQARTLQGSGITLLAPSGAINAGETGSSTKKPSELGIVTVAGGAINGVARDDILVNQSRIFTLAQGDILLWSSTGDVDAGRGAKTVVGAPAPIYRLDANGRIVVDTSGSFSGSGIAVLDAKSALDLYAPAGAIDAGEAGIRALGSVTLGADVVRGADDIVGGSVAGAPPAAPTVGVTAGLSQAADAANNAARPGEDDEEERRRKRRARRQLLLEFLGFGQG
ncbi:MAG TPA: filamentous hemagglutinin family protein [Ideonella sp.]|uniref:filamentous haemagglutinin family protein n=1 Tax=Ideonella sp. TaxID=1929293 RepID=UPI002E2F2167|nr:filamentous haemagglutinin family protein [Ideonella sp.]HEX5682705.1 filamentous hemagglutinin family protein [Ideonella sp.]